MLRKYSSSPKFHIYHKPTLKSNSEVKQLGSFRKHNPFTNKRLQLGAIGSISKRAQSRNQDKLSRKKLVSKFNSVKSKRVNSEENNLKNLGDKLKMPDLFLKNKLHGEC